MPKDGVIEQKIDHVKTRIFYNTSNCQASDNWKRDYVRNVKTYAEIVKSKSSGVYSKTKLHNVTNVEKQYRPLVDTKRAKNNMYQGVNVALDHVAKTRNIGKFPHTLHKQNNVRFAKNFNQMVSVVNTREKTGKTWSRADRIHSASSHDQIKVKGKTYSDDSNDFVSKNKFDVLVNLDNDVNVTQTDTDCREVTAGGHGHTNKVSTGCKNKATLVSEGVVSRVMATFPLTEDKYILQAMFRPRHRDTIANASTIKTFQTWNAQNNDKFGFIPLGDLMLPESNKKNTNKDSIFSIHDRICQSNTFNFMQAQFQVQSQLNPDVWDKYLTNYWDKQLGFLIRYGFPLDFHHNTPLKSNEVNHKSAVDFQEHVELYLQEEMAHGAILGPFKDPPLSNCTSPPS